MGVSDPRRFEVPFLDLHPSAMMLVCFHCRVHTQSVSADSHASAIPSRVRRRWRWVRTATVSDSVAALDNAIGLMNMEVDTIVLDINAFGRIHSRLSWIDSFFITTLLKHYSETVRQYILFSDTTVLGPFRDIRETKRLFQSHGYTYSRIGSSPNIRVMVKAA